MSTNYTHDELNQIYSDSYRPGNKGHAAFFFILAPAALLMMFAMSKNSAGGVLAALALAAVGGVVAVVFFLRAAAVARPANKQIRAEALQDMRTLAGGIRAARAGDVAGAAYADEIVTMRQQARRDGLAPGEIAEAEVHGNRAFAQLQALRAAGLLSPEEIDKYNLDALGASAAAGHLADADADDWNGEPVDYPHDEDHPSGGDGDFLSELMGEDNGEDI